MSEASIMMIILTMSKDNRPEERSLNIGPPHVHPHVDGLVQEYVVLGGGWEDVGEGEVPGCRR